MTMKKSIYTLLALALLLTSCDSWVENAGTPSNTLTKEQLNKVCDDCYRPNKYYQ